MRVFHMLVVYIKFQTYIFFIGNVFKNDYIM